VTRLCPISQQGFSTHAKCHPNGSPSEATAPHTFGLAQSVCRPSLASLRSPSATLSKVEGAPRPSLWSANRNTSGCNYWMAGRNNDR
jgi:hypothetical protein